MINRGFKKEDKKNIPDIHRVVKIYRISGAALTCSLTTGDKTTSSNLEGIRSRKIRLRFLDFQIAKSLFSWSGTTEEVKL